jgi:hypothetical protein
VASCVPESGLAAAPLPGEVGVYRAGTLTLAVGDDLAQHPGSSGEAIAVLTGGRPVVLSVDPHSPVRAALYYTTPRNPRLPPTIDNGRAAVRFPACGRHVHRFGGGIVFAGRGCARLHVQPAGRPPHTMLIPVANSLRGCPPARSALDLDPAAITLGVSCPTRSSGACGRTGVAVRIGVPTVLVTARLAGRLVTLSPPAGPHDNTWLGYLWSAPIEPGTRVRVRVTAFFSGRSAAAMTAYVPLSAGFG